ncbi:MAG: serine/threonine protein kinase [Gammaproteobacteria bacterium]|nr:serine/threonine protein kinase [Gammaproteobacteria bacterium]
MKVAGLPKRNRIIALSFVSVLLLLIYGPLSQWFVAADRFLYDQYSSALPKQSLSNAYIVSIDPQRETKSQVLDRYGDILRKLKNVNVDRIILPRPPEISSADGLPGWGKLLASGAPVFVPTQHPLAALSQHDGYVQVNMDSDGVLRSSNLWHLNGGVMSPALPLAVSLYDTGAQAPSHVSNSDDKIYYSKYVELPRFSVAEVLSGAADSALQGATIFVDADPALAGAQAVLPSGQFVTHSELTAALMADIANGKTIATPSWARAIEWLTPVIFAVTAVLLLPGRSRRDIGLAAIIAVAAVLVIQALLLFGLHVRIDMGRALVLFCGAAMLCIYLVEDVKKETQEAFKKGSDFLMAGRLEPAFAELRRCNPSDTVAAAMYKLSLAFEQQSKPERAEAVLEWMKRTHVGGAAETAAATETLNGIPQRLGRYVIEKRIGRGAMGSVYLAKDPRINRPVAVKAIPIEKEFEDEELKEARQRFYREAESAGRLTHPNIVTIYDAGEDKGLAYIAMEYVPGIPLTDFTSPTRLLAPKRAFDLAAKTAQALDYAHNQGVIHRDIKPANLIYNPKDASLKISDFGVARLTDNNRTKTGIVLGTPMYMSPEQLGAEDITGLSDLFSLGVTLYELLIGEAPFQATNIAVLMTKITTDDPEPLTNRRRGIPPITDAILAKAMAKRPEDRFSCGAEMAAALRDCARFA